MRKISFNHWKENMVETLELPKDLVYGAVPLTVTGRRELLVENYRGILEYTTECIRLQAKDCRVSIQGKALNIQYYTNEEMKINGIIKSILYE